MPQLFQLRYYKINIFFLSILGLWPYQSRARRRTILAIFIFLVMSIIIPQIIAVVEFRDDPEIIMESIGPFVTDVACGTKLANMVFNSNKMLKLIQRMENDWKYLTDQPEIRILHKYAEIGRRFTIVYAAGIYTVGVLFMIQPVVPQIIIALKLTCELKEKKFPFPVDYYGIDFETYYYYMTVHSYLCVTAIVTVIVAADTIFIVYVQHACGMFTVVGHQLKRMGDRVPESYQHLLRSSKDPGFQQVATFIKKHSQVIEFANLLETSYTWSFFSFVGLNMAVMSVTGFQAMINLDKNVQDAARYAAFTAAQLMHLFFQSFFSQRLMDHSQQVRGYIYQAEWYKMPLRTQKLINLVTMRTYIPCQLTAGKFMVMSLENFTAIVKTSMSYFTLLRSMQ